MVNEKEESSDSDDGMTDQPQIVTAEIVTVGDIILEEIMAITGDEEVEAEAAGSAQPQDEPAQNPEGAEKKQKKKKKPAKNITKTELQQQVEAQRREIESLKKKGKDRESKKEKGAHSSIIEEQTLILRQIQEEARKNRQEMERIREENQRLRNSLSPLESSTPITQRVETLTLEQAIEINFPLDLGDRDPKEGKIILENICASIWDEHPKTNLLDRLENLTYDTLEEFRTKFDEFSIRHQAYYLEVLSYHQFQHKTRRSAMLDVLKEIQQGCKNPIKTLVAVKACCINNIVERTQGCHDGPQAKMLALTLAVFYMEFKKKFSYYGRTLSAIGLDNLNRNATFIISETQAALIVLSFSIEMRQNNTWIYRQPTEKTFIVANNLKRIVRETGNETAYEIIDGATHHHLSDYIVELQRRSNEGPPLEVDEEKFLTYMVISMIRSLDTLETWVKQNNVSCNRMFADTRLKTASDLANLI